MDEEKYLKTKDEIKDYKMGIFISLSAGPMVLALCLEFFHLFTSFGPLFEFLFSVAYCVVFILSALWAKSKVEIKLERKRRKALLPHHIAASISLSPLERSLSPLELREYLKRRVNIKKYKMSVFISLTAGPILLAFCLEFFHLFTSFGPLFEFLFSIAYCVVFILLALWAKSKARGFEIELERERRKAQRIVSGKYDR